MNHRSDLHTWTMIFDILLLALGFVAAYYTAQISKGVSYKGLKIVTVGFVLLAITHLIETGTFMYFRALIGLEKIAIENIEMTHRILIFLSFFCIFWGYKKLEKFVRQ